MSSTTLDVVYTGLSSISINPHFQLGKNRLSPQENGIISIYLNPFARKPSGELIDIFEECHVELAITGTMNGAEKAWVEHQTREGWQKSFDFKMLSGYGIRLYRVSLFNFEYALAPDNTQENLLRIASNWYEAFTECGNTYKTLSWGISSMDLGFDLNLALFDKFPIY